ncbi:hypothetical protein RhiirB3_460661 [Rhizophagus irregularis]|nr:hypothetical protein RhiirB3_460661 [Rhizophagus irregularis]
MGCRRSKTSQKKSQARFKVLKAARKSQLRQLEVDFSGSFRLADGVFIPPGYLVLNGLPL